VVPKRPRTVSLPRLRPGPRGHQCADPVQNAVQPEGELTVGRVESLEHARGDEPGDRGEPLRVISWLAAAFGLLVASPEAANAFMFVPMIVAYASSAFVPVRTMPSWLHGVAGHQPATPVIETMRGLLLGTHVGANGWQAVAWCGGIFVGSVGLSAAAFRRRAR